MALGACLLLESMYIYSLGFFHGKTFLQGRISARCINIITIFVHCNLIHVYALCSPEWSINRWGPASEARHRGDHRWAHGEEPTAADELPDAAAPAAANTAAATAAGTPVAAARPATAAAAPEIGIDRGSRKDAKANWTWQIGKDVRDGRGEKRNNLLHISDRL